MTGGAPGHAATTVSTAMLVGGVVLAAAAPLYLPAWWAARRCAALAGPDLVGPDAQLDSMRTPVR